MKVLIVSLNRYRNPMPVMPTGACMVADAAEHAGHEVAFLDLMFSRRPLREIERALGDCRPDVVGLSVRNIDNNDLHEPARLFADLRPAAQCVRANSNVTLVLGGSAVGVMPEAMLKESGAEYAVPGDGEAVFPQLLAAIESESDGGDLPGVARLQNGRVRVTPRPEGEILNGFCVPNYRRWMDIGRYQRMMCTAGVQTKRGCEFACVYCTYAFGEGRTFRFHPVEAVTDGVQGMVRAGIPDIEFVDSVFNAPRDHALALCESLARAKTGGRFQSLELNPRFVDGELLGAMHHAGFVGIGITAESASDPVLKGLNKGYTADDVCRAAEAVRHTPIPCTWIFLLGGPGETRQTVRETLRFVDRRVRPSDIAFFNIGLRIYPGTELERIAREEGVLHVPPEDMLDPVFYVSPGLDPDWLMRELDEFLAQHRNAIGPRSIGLPLLPLIYRIGYRLGMRPPLWRRTRQLRGLLGMLGVRP